jgi:hypothetical protein
MIIVSKGSMRQRLNEMLTVRTTPFADWADFNRFWEAELTQEDTENLNWLEDEYGPEECERWFFRILGESGLFSEIIAQERALEEENARYKHAWENEMRSGVDYHKKWFGGE